LILIGNPHNSGTKQAAAYPPVVIAITKTGSTGGMLPSAKTSIKLAAREIKIVYKEWRTDVFEFMDKNRK
jgi:hypothetical protein